MVSHTVRGLQVIMDALQDTSEKYNIRINTKKTKIMRMSTVEWRTMKITVEINRGSQIFLDATLAHAPTNFGPKRHFLV